MKPFNIYIGFDSREAVAYDVCEYSIKSRAKRPINISPLKHRELRKKGLFKRPWRFENSTGIMVDGMDEKPFSTEFSHTRFLIPELNQFEGWALFMDCDMIFQCDVSELLAMADPKYAVMLVKHNHRPKEQNKMDDQPQSQYHRKNWSSFVLWNCSHPSNKKLNASIVNTMTGTDLHAFTWLQDFEIGHLGFEWNWIEGISPGNIIPKVIHYTLGGPWFKEWQDVLYADKWLQDYKRMTRANEGVLSGIL